MHTQHLCYCPRTAVPKPRGGENREEPHGGRPGTWKGWAPHSGFQGGGTSGAGRSLEEAGRHWTGQPVQPGEGVRGALEGTHRVGGQLHAPCREEARGGCVATAESRLCPGLQAPHGHPPQDTGTSTAGDLFHSTVSRFSWSTRPADTSHSKALLFLSAPYTKELQGQVPPQLVVRASSRARPLLPCWLTSETSRAVTLRCRKFTNP